MKRAFFIAVFVCIACWIGSPLVSAARQEKPIISNYSQEISIEQGSFAFEKFNIFIHRPPYSGSHIYIYGTIKNNTNKNWKKLKFIIQYFNPAGAKIYQSELDVRNEFKAGTAQTVGYDENEWHKKYHVFGSAYASSSIDLKPVSAIKIVLAESELAGSVNVTLIEPQASAELKYSDNYIDISFEIPKNSSSIDFVLKNLSSSAIKIDWNQVAFVSLNGNTSKVIHSGVKLISKGENQSASYIPPRANLSDLVQPTSHYYFTNYESISNDWEYIPILPDGEAALSSVGKTFSVYLPMEIEGNSRPYNFVFKINSAAN